MASVWWTMLIISSSDVHDIRAREIAMGKNTARNVQVKRFFGIMSVLYNSEQRETFAETADAVSSVIVASLDFPDPTF